MGGNKIVYKEAYEQALQGKTRSLWQRLTHRFQDLYTQSSREQGERDGAAARATSQEGGTSAPTSAQH